MPPVVSAEGQSSETVGRQCHRETISQPSRGPLLQTKDISPASAFGGFSALIEQQEFTVFRNVLRARLVKQRNILLAFRFRGMYGDLETPGIPRHKHPAIGRDVSQR